MSQEVVVSGEAEEKVPSEHENDKEEKQIEGNLQEYYENEQIQNLPNEDHQHLNSPIDEQRLDDSQTYLPDSQNYLPEEKEEEEYNNLEIEEQYEEDESQNPDYEQREEDGDEDFTEQSSSLTGKGRKRKGNRKEKSSKKSRKRSKKSATGSSTADGGDTRESVSKSTQPLSADEKEILDAIKGHSRFRREEIDAIESNNDRIAKDFVIRMQQAAVDDDVSLSATPPEPALAKLSMVNDVLHICTKSILQPSLLEAGILEALSDWLGDGQHNLPNSNVRSCVLKVLLEIPVKGVTKKPINKQLLEIFDGLDVHHLKSSRIARIIKRLSNNPKETPENKNMANIILERWSRMIFSLHDDYKQQGSSSYGAGEGRHGGMRTADEVAEMRTREQMMANLAAGEGVGYALDEKVVEVNRPNRAKIPRITGFDFIYKPQSKLLDTRKTEPTLSQKKIQKKLQDLKKEN